jgi:sugar phosphate permease
MPNNNSSLGTLYGLATGDEDARVCKDIPEECCNHQPRNFFAYLLSNVFTKIADELCSARLIFPWLIGALGAPAIFVGFLVPIREAGVLLPQLIVAAVIRRIAIRKWVWVAGGALSALTILLLALSIEHVEGTSAGWLIIGLLSLYSLSRGICSVSAKDVLGKTVSKSHRGTLMGLAASVAGAATLFIGLLIYLQSPRSNGDHLFLLLLVGAVAAYLAAIAAFALIREMPGATEGGGNAINVAFKSLGIVKSDREFRHFLIARGYLLSIALMPPFYVLLAQQRGVELDGLGILIVASGLASMVSSPIWGKLSDQSSRWTMAIAALLAGAMGITVLGIESTGLYLFDGKWQITGLFFLVSVFHGGARLGRKTYLVDMANQENRSTYVAVSNTLIGILMLASGAIGALADIFDVTTVIGILGAVSLISTFYILTIREVSEG